VQLPPPDVPEWEEHELLASEKEVLGAYVSGHPLARHAGALETFQLDAIHELGGLADDTGTRIGGILTHVDVKISKRDQRPWAVAAIEGLDTSIEVMVFSDAYAGHIDVLKPEEPVLIEGILSRRDGEEAKLIAERILSLDTAAQELTRELHIRMHQASTAVDDLHRLRRICEETPGNTEVILCLICADGEIAFVKPSGLTVTNSAAFRHAVKDLFGEECLLEKVDRTRPVSNRRRGWRPAATGRSGAAVAAE